MASILAIGVGVLVIIIAAVILLVGVQVYASLDASFNCSKSPYNTSTSASSTCTTTKSNTWLILGIAPYGLIFAGLFLIFGSILGLGALAGGSRGVAPGGLIGAAFMGAYRMKEHARNKSFTSDERKPK